MVPCLIVAGLGWSVRYEGEFFVVKDAPVEVLFEDGHDGLLKSLYPKIEKNVTALKGQNIWKVELEDIRNQLLALPWVEKVKVRRSFPDRISVAMELQKVALLYIDSKNKIHPVSEAGEILPAVKPVAAPMAPIFRDKKLAKNKKKLQKLIANYNDLPNINALKRTNIASVSWGEVTGLSLKLIAEKTLVHFGEDNISTKGLQVLRVTDYLKSQKHKARVIDASFSKKVLVRLRKRP